MGADAAKLVNAGKCADRCMIFNDNVAGERSRIGQNNVVTKDAVVADVRVRHQKIVVADARVSASSLGSPVHIYIFAKDIMIADRKKRFFTLEFEILRLKTDRPERIELVVLADLRRTFD